MQQAVNVVFNGWSSTQETVIDELIALADMASLPSLPSQTWLSRLYRFIFNLRSPPEPPPAPYPIARLPGLIQSIPSVKEWVIDASMLHASELRVFLDSAPTDRTNESARTIRVQGRNEEWGAQVHAEFLRSGEHPYVTIVGQPYAD